MPVVTRVLVRSSDWSSQFLDSLGGVGYAIPDGPNQVLPLPWVNLNTLIVEFSENVIVTQDDLALVGVNVEDYAFSAFSYDAVTHRATWTITQNLELDKLLIDLDGNSVGAVTDAAGNRLDGDWTNPTWNPPLAPLGGDAWPSGDGTPGGDFHFRFNVLPGDANQSGAVNVDDLALLLNNYDKTGKIWSDGDFTGDGVVDVADLATLLNNYDKGLPSSEPVVPTLMASQTADTSPARLNVCRSERG